MNFILKIKFGILVPFSYLFNNQQSYFSNYLNRTCIYEIKTFPLSFYTYTPVLPTLLSSSSSFFLVSLHLPLNEFFSPIIGLFLFDYHSISSEFSVLFPELALHVYVLVFQFDTHFGGWFGFSDFDSFHDKNELGYEFFKFLARFRDRKPDWALGPWPTDHGILYC